MKKRVLSVIVCLALICMFAMTGCGSGGTSKTTDTKADRTITDDSGRSVTIPGTGALEKIYFTSPIAQIYCFTLAPELAGGSTMQFTDAELKYLPAGTGDLPYLGTLAMGGELNPEAIINENIQIIFNIASSAPTESDKSFSDNLQEQTGIPVVLLNGSLENTANCYTTLGSILGKEDAAKELASYCQDTMKKVTDAVAKVPESERVSLYYAEGPEGLATEPESSSHAQAYKIAGAKNVAQVESTSAKGMSSVSLEQVISWDPEVIIAWDDVVRGGADEIIRTSEDWSDITAVKTGRVYTMPNVPFSWCDRPPSVNRYLGIQWVANMLYPTYYNVDMIEVTQNFYSKFYHADITVDQAKEILGNSYTK